MTASIAARRSSSVRGRGVQEMMIGVTSSHGVKGAAGAHRSREGRAEGVEARQPADARPDVRTDASRRTRDPCALLQPERARARACAAATPCRIIPPPVPRRRSIISSRPRGAGGDFAFGRPARACCSSSDHDRAGEPARARHARQAPPSCAHMMPSLTGRISAPRYIQTFAFGAIDAPSATHGGEPLTQRIDFSTLAASAAPGLPRASDQPGRRVTEH